jgi:hypothetical protein
MRIFLLIMTLSFFAFAQDDFVPLHKNLAPVQCLINNAKSTQPKANQYNVTVSPIVTVSVIGADLEVRAVNSEEIAFKDLVPGLFRGRFKKDDYGYVFVQKVQGYTIKHFMNNVLYKDFAKEITNKQYHILSQVFITVLIEKTIYGIVADFQQLE